MKSLLLWSILFSLVAPLAAEAKEKPSASGESDYLTKEACIAQMGIFLSPEGTIEAGIAALQNIAVGSGVSNQCLENLVQQWDRHFPTPDTLEWLNSSVYESIKPASYSEKTAEALEGKLECVNPYEPGSYDYKDYALMFKKKCSGKWLSKAQEAALKKQLKEERRRVDLASVTKGVYESPGSEISSLLITIPSFKEEIGQLEKKLNCYNEFEPGSQSHKWHVEEFATQCKGKWISKEAHQKLQAKIKETQEKMQKEEEARMAREDFLTLYFEYLENLPSPEVFRKLVPLILAGRCFVDAAPGSEEFKERFSDSDACKGREIGANRLRELQKAALALLPGLEAKEKNWKNIKKEIEDARAAMEKQATENDGKFNTTHRLIIAYRAYLRKKGPGAKVSNFCEEHAESEAIESEYFQSDLPGNPHEGEKAKKARDLGLTPAEFAALHGYTSNFYSEINPLLYEKKELDEKYQLFLKTMNRALAKAPVYRGRVTRWASLKKEFIQQHQPGKTICYPAYTSTSKKADWTFDGNTKFLIQAGSNGHLVQAVSSVPEEEEVLFKAGTCFKVLAKKVTKKADGGEDDEENTRTEIVMAEVGATPPAKGKGKGKGKGK